MPHRKKILLSDSNEALSMLLADSLRERGNFHVFHAKDEDETTKALHRHRRLMALGDRITIIRCSRLHGVVRFVCQNRLRNW